MATAAACFILSDGQLVAVRILQPTTGSAQASAVPTRSLVHSLRPSISSLAVIDTASRNV
jgi:hypothetical protein